MLTYGREARLPAHPSESEDLLNGTFLQRMYELTTKMPNTRKQALLQIRDNQQKQKANHDRKLKDTTTFGIGDKVLAYDMQRMNAPSHKFAPKWKGPYYVHAILTNGAYKLRELDGRVLSTPINGTHLKKYLERKR